MDKNIITTSGTVRFSLKNLNSKKDTPIIFTYSYGRGNRLKFSTGYKIHPKNWDQKNQKVRAIAHISNREEVNSNLSEIRSKFLKGITQLQGTNIKYDKYTLKELYYNIINKKAPQSTIKRIEFLEFADRFVEQKEKQLTLTSTASLNLITIRAYKQTIKKIREYSKAEDRKVNFETIDLEFYYSFVNYLEEKNMSLNTIGKHIKNIIALMNRATEDGLNTNLAYKHREFRRVSETTTAIYLTAEEIEKIENLDLSKNQTWQHARDLFLIGYYTGQRVSDFNGLGINDIRVFEQRQVFEITQKKTSKTIYIPVHPNLKRIFKTRYNGMAPLKMPELLLNKYIKKVGEKAKINESINIIKTKGGKRNTESKKKWELIGTHTARRSFCTNAYLSKMPVIDIMAISGHTTEKEFYKYIKVTPQERAIKIADSAFFK
ncbi:site-specific integrase [Aurantibacter crassamenti]|uniref:phage integrase SAM-like domain-containing protein n=1 Tax=Aurantibacter crassamenti TaxID=1837375 RepID=UPI00193951E1|nr:phage integrase SAM-like domain-containing protein [Aurantibacter crassamenti]MBM1105160.1 site-specific integrase [Aurantibacter crassamenti]